MNSPVFNIIIPVFNEEDNLERISVEMNKFLAQAPCSSSILFVNDGSTDTSLEKIKELCSQHQNFHYLSLNQNYGLSSALMAGIQATQSPYVGYIDADLQTSPMDFSLLLAEKERYGLVLGIRTNRKDSFLKKTSSRIANSFRRMMTGDGVSDTGCPLKVMQTPLAQKLPFFDGFHRFLPALFQIIGSEVKEIPVQHFPRIAGEAKYGLLNRLIGPFKDCFYVRWLKKRYRNYQIEEQA